MGPVSGRALAEWVISYWKAQGLPPTGGASRRQFAEFEAKYGLWLPNDRRELWKRSNGTPNEDGDCEHHYFWPIESFRPYETHPWAIIFADYLQECWWYAVDLTDGGPQGLGAVYEVGCVGDEVLPIASSSLEFIEPYLRDDARLYPAQPDRRLTRLSPGARSKWLL